MIKTNITANHSAWAMKKPRQGYSLIAPGLVADKEWQEIVRDDLFPVAASLADSAEGKVYAASDPTPLLTVPGITSDPWSYPTTTPSLYHFDDDVVFAMRAIVKALFQGNVVRNYLGTIDFTLRRQANSVYPFDTTDLGVKTKLVLDCFRNFDEISYLAYKNQWRELEARHSIYFVIEIKRRFMTEACSSFKVDKNYRLLEAVAKRREYDTPDHGKVTAETFFTEWLIACMHAMRVRDVWAVPIGVNSPVKVLNDAMNKCEFELAPDTTHASDFKGWLAKHQGIIVGKKPYGGDLHSMDKHCCSALLDLALSSLQEEIGISDRFIHWIRASWYSPYTCNGIWHSKKEVLPYRVNADPLDPMLIASAQLISGTALTTNIGRLCVKAAECAAFFKMGFLPRSEEAVMRYVRWQHDFGFFNHNQSDDMNWWMDDKHGEVFLRDYPAALKASYSGFEIDVVPPDQASYLSQRVYKDRISAQYRCTHDAIRGLAKTVCPETNLPAWYREAKETYNAEQMHELMGMRGKGDERFASAGRKFPAFGLLYQKIPEYTESNPLAAPLFDALFRCYDKKDRRILPSLRSLAKLEAEVLDSWEVDAANVVDAEVLEDPDKAIYKYSPDEISRGVYKLHFTSIPAEQTRPVVNVILD